MKRPETEALAVGVESVLSHPVLVNVRRFIEPATDGLALRRTAIRSAEEQNILKPKFAYCANVV